MTYKKLRIGIIVSVLILAVIFIVLPIVIRIISKPGGEPSSPSNVTEDPLTDGLQRLAVYTACICQYNMAQTGSTLGDPHDYYTPRHIRDYLTERTGSRTVTNTYYGVCYDYAQAAYNEILENQRYYEELGVNRWYIVVTFDNSSEIVLYNPVPEAQATLVINGVSVKEYSRQNVRAHGRAIKHGWLWVYGNDDTIYWIDPTWTDNNGYIWWGIVQDGEEIQGPPLESLCITKVNPNAFTLISRGDGAKNLGNYDQAREDYDDVIKLEPTNAVAYFSRGNAYYKIGDYDQAIVNYDEAIRLDPNYAAAYNYRGNAYDDKGDHDRAIVDYDQAIRLNPNYAQAYYDRGIAYGRKGDYDQAIVNYDQAINLNSNYAAAYRNRGNAYRAKGDYDQAIVNYDQATRLDPNNKIAYFNRGVAYDLKGDYDRAMEDLNEAIRLDPNYAIAYNSRGVVYRHKGDDDQAITNYEMALSIDPNNSTARRNLEIARQRRGW